MSGRSQCDRVLAVLRDGRPHTMTEIHQQAGFMRLNSRISELRNRGHNITCDRSRNPVYQLVASVVAAPAPVPSAGVDLGAAPTERVAEQDGIEKTAIEVPLGETATLHGDGSGERLPEAPRDDSQLALVLPTKQRELWS